MLATRRVRGDMKPTRPRGRDVRVLSGLRTIELGVFFAWGARPRCRGVCGWRSRTVDSGGTERQATSRCKLTRAQRAPLGSAACRGTPRPWLGGGALKERARGGSTRVCRPQQKSAPAADAGRTRVHATPFDHPRTHSASPLKPTYHTYAQAQRLPAIGCHGPHDT